MLVLFVSMVYIQKSVVFVESLLHKEEERLSFKVDCELLETIIREVFPKFRWRFRNRSEDWSGFFHVHVVSVVLCLDFFLDVL